MRMPSFLKLVARLSKSVVLGGLTLGSFLGTASETNAQTNSQFVPVQNQQIGRTNNGFQAPNQTNRAATGFTTPAKSYTPRIQPLGPSLNSRQNTIGQNTVGLTGTTQDSLNQNSAIQNTGTQQTGTAQANIRQRGTTFRSYTITKTTSSAVSKRIKSQLGNLVEIVNDAANNRLIVNTSPVNHRMVEQIVQGVERTQTPTQTTTLTTSSIKSIRSFNVSIDRIRKAADDLSHLYIDKNRIIVAADETVGKLMIFSTEQDYEEIAAYLKRKGFLDSKKSRDLGKPGVKMHDLKNIGWRQLEQSIYQGWGNAIKIEISTDGAYSRIQIPTIDQSRSQIQIDRRNNRLQIEASGLQLNAITRLVELLDQPAGKQKVSIVKTRPDAIDQIQSTVSMYKFAALQQDVQPRTTSAIIGKPRVKNGVYAIYQDQDETNNNAQETPDDRLGPIGRVEIITIPGTDIIILKGDPDDVARVRRLIEELEKTSEEYKPQIEVLPLKHVDNIAVQAIATEVYTNFYEPSLGQTSITALVKPNALLLVGTPEGVKQARALVEKLDVAVEPSTEFKVFRIKHMSAVDLENRLRAFYLGQSAQGGIGANAGGGGVNQNTAGGFAGEGLATRLRLASDYRSNALFVHASQRDMAEITKFINEIDVESADDGPMDFLKIIRLKNSTAAELAPVLQDILTGQLQGAGQSNLGNNQFNQQFNNLNNQQFSQIRSAMLALQSLDPAGKIVRSSILFDTRITADENSNSLIIKAPKESIPLIELLVAQLDKLPDVESRIKIFELENAAAPQIVETIQNLFETTQGGGQGGGAGAGGTNIIPLETGGYDSTIVSLRLAADARSNTVIAAGSQGDINIIEALVARLDEDIESKYIHKVYRLHNVTADVVEEAISGWLTGRSDTLGTDPRVVGSGDGSLEAVKRAITVQAETETNSLIVSAHKEYVHIIENIIRDIDFKKQVIIQAVIAEVELQDTFEFGIEWGVQDSLVFDRGLGGATATDLIGFPFNQGGLGNDISAGSLGILSREDVAAQALSNLSIGRSNSDLGYGGLVLSAGNESINVLLRALDDKTKVDILSRPQITTMENIQAFVQIGQDLPYITGVDNSNNVGGATTFATDFLELGVTLSVTPRVRPDGEIWLRVDVGNSSVADDDGVVVQTTATGDPITQPIINVTTLQTDIVARSGQTVVLGGLIQSATQDIVRGIPFFSNIPGIGRLFRFESTQNARRELFVILRPIVIDSPEDREMLMRIESSRLSWCISDVNEIHGSIYDDETLAGETDTIYPDRTPTGYHKEADADNKNSNQQKTNVGSLAPLNGDLSRNGQTPNRFNQMPLPNQRVMNSNYRQVSGQGSQVQPTNFQQNAPEKKKKKNPFSFSFGNKR